MRKKKKTRKIIQKKPEKEKINKITNDNSLEKNKNLEKINEKTTNTKKAVSKKELDKTNVNKEELEKTKKEVKKDLDNKKEQQKTIKQINNQKTNQVKNRKKRTRKRRKNRNRRKNKNKKIIIILILIFILTITLVASLLIHKNNVEQNKLQEQIKLTEDIKSHYNEYVITTNETDLYVFEKGKYIKKGKISKDEELTLDKLDISYKDEYFKITNFDNEYYIYYKDVSIINELSSIKNRYKRYIPFNLNIITKDKTNFYNEENVLVYTFNKSYTFPIIVKLKDSYGVEYNNKLLYIKQDDIKEIKESDNTTEKNTKGIAVLNYHFFEDSDKPGDSCNQSICLTTNNLKKHLEYIKEKNIFTPTLKELEMYIDGYIRLPKSVVLTIDDGWRAKIGSKVISEYELNATIFLMSKYYDPKNYQNEYIEVHSHGYDIHNGGLCPGGQGGEIKCMEKTKLLNDLNLSREKLNNTTYFCYPFYEYNDYSIKVLKEAGFTMAFGGPYEGGKQKVTPGANKFKLPRYIIYNTTNKNNIANYIN